MRTEEWAPGDVSLTIAMAQLHQQWGVAEKLLIDRGQAGAAIEMYQNLGMLKDAVRSV